MKNHKAKNAPFEWRLVYSRGVQVSKEKVKSLP